MKHLFFIALVGLMTSCSHESAITSGWNYNNPAPGGYSDLGQANKSRLVERMPDGDPDEFKSRVVIYNASVELAVKKTDSINNRLMNIAQRHGGYAVNLGSTYSSIRVKADQLNFALKEVEILGQVKSKTVSGNDVTDEFRDNEIRLDNARKARERYLELLKKAENVEAALKVERELERLNTEIDRLEGRQNQVKHLNQFSTINVRYYEKAKPGLLGYIGIGLYKGVKWLFVRN